MVLQGNEPEILNGGQEGELGSFLPFCWLNIVTYFSYSRSHTCRCLMGLYFYLGFPQMSPLLCMRCPRSFKNYELFPKGLQYSVGAGQNVSSNP
jgi:hypothetical protein